MSGCTRAVRNKPMNEQESAARGARRRFLWWMAAMPSAGLGVWWVASIVLHTALFGMLAVITPKRADVAASPDEFTMTISPDRVEEVVEEIRDRVSEEFQQQVQELTDIQRELEEANVAKVQQYNELMKSEALLAPDAVKKAVQDAIAAQTEAITAQEQAQTALSKLDKAQAASSDASANDDHAPAKTNAAAAKAELEATQSTTSAAQNKASAAQARIEQHIANIFPDAANEIRKTNRANTELQNEAAKLQMDAKNATQALERLRVNEDALRTKVQNNKTRTALEKKRQADDAGKIAELDSNIKTAAEQAQQLAEQAKQAQTKAKDALEHSVDHIAMAVEKASQPVPASVPAPAKSNPTMPKNLAALYEQAIRTEDALTNTYKHVRAAELAAIRKLPMAQALALTEVAKPVRNNVDTKILSAAIRDAQGVHKQEKAINAASEELGSMVSLARRMRALATQDASANVTVEGLQGQAAHSDKMEQLALQSEGEHAKDLTGEMGEGDKKKGKGSGFDGAPNDPLLPKKTGPPSYLFAAPREMRPIPGRTIGGEMQTTAPGRYGRWMFVDSWYIIGPWPNPNRKNLNTKFPPETVVDLNATYTGGRGDEKPLAVRWKFYQAPAIVNTGYVETTGQIVPPGLGEYEIYYAYTEIRSDEAHDLWVAIGSDDQSKIWINDEMIWKSSDELKNWVPNEGLRKVHFRRGINRILYRYENGHSSGCFSFFISLVSTDSAPLPTNVPRGR